jgi:hypothetical protein
VCGDFPGTELSCGDGHGAMPGEADAGVAVQPQLPA